MQCPHCEKAIEATAKFCRSCGQALVAASSLSGQHGKLPKATSKALWSTQTIDPDELVGTGISKIITGDGFFMVAIFLSVTHTSVSSFLWLLLLLPAFYLFGQGFSDVFRARQIRRRQQDEKLGAAEMVAELPTTAFSLMDSVANQTTRKLVTGTSGKLGA